MGDSSYPLARESFGGGYIEKPLFHKATRYTGES